MLLLLALPHLSAAALAATITVGPTGDYATLAEALAVSTDGDALEIAAGTYTDCLDPGGRSLSLQGAGAGSTVLDGGGCAAVISANAGETLAIRGLSITNAGGRAVDASGGAALELSQVEISGVGDSGLDGGAMRLDGASALVAESTLSDGQGRYGGLVWLGDGTLILEDSTLSGGAAEEGGGAVALGENAILEGNFLVLDANTAYRGGAIYTEDGGAVTLTSATITANLATEHGGAVYGEQGLALSAIDTSFGGNQAVYGSGGVAYLYGTGSVTLSASTVEDSYAREDGGALYLDYNIDCEIVGGALRRNQSYAGVGGAISASFYGDLLVDGVSVEANSSFGSGGALYLEFLVGQVEILSSTFSDNLTEAGEGGAITTSNAMDITIQDSVFSANRAAYDGGALSLDPSGRVEIADSTFSRNEASEGSGGAMLLDAWLEDAWSVALDRLSLEGNRAGLDGGGISVYGLAELTLSSSSFEDNAADLSGLGRVGGALHLERVGALSVTRACLCANTAAHGGGAYLDGVTESAWWNNALLQNVATGSGGALYATGSGLDLYQNDLLSNEAADGAVAVAGGSLSLVNDLLAWSLGGALSLDEAARDAATVRYDAWYANDSDTVGAASLDDAADGHVHADPLLVAYVADGACGDDLHLAADSPLIDAGDPTVYDGGGSRSDIGLDGGPLEEGQTRPEGETGEDTGEPTDDTGGPVDDSGGSGDDSGDPPGAETGTGVEPKETGDCACASGSPRGAGAAGGLALLVLMWRRAGGRSAAPRRPSRAAREMYRRKLPI